MKILVVGGTSGFGKDIAEHFNADAIGRKTGHNLPENLGAVVELTKNYNCIINCVSDSTQGLIASAMFDEHHRLNLNTYFITVGSMTWRIETPEQGKRQLFDWAESLITIKTTVKHTLLNPAWMYNTKEVGLFDSISKDDMLSLFEFLIKRFTLNSTISMIDIQGTPK